MVLGLFPGGGLDEYVSSVGIVLDIQVEGLGHETQRNH